MARTKGITGQKFGRLTAIEQIGKNKHNNYIWLCQCECGNSHETTATALLQGRVRSCGCLMRETSAEIFRKAQKKSIEVCTKHKKTPRKLYWTWSRMKGRCYCETNEHFKDYGGRGITVCDEWRHSFESFRDWALAHGWEKTAHGKHNTTKTLDRIDVNGPYSPENCRFVDMKTQCANRRSTNLVEGVPLIEWCKQNGVSYGTINTRMQRGWSLEKAVQTPIKQRRKKHEQVVESIGTLFLR